MQSENTSPDIRRATRTFADDDLRWWEVALWLSPVVIVLTIASVFIR